MKYVLFNYNIKIFINKNAEYRYTSIISICFHRHRIIRFLFFTTDIIFYTYWMSTSGLSYSFSVNCFWHPHFLRVVFSNRFVVVSAGTEVDVTPLQQTRTSFFTNPHRLGYICFLRFSMAWGQSCRKTHDSWRFLHSKTFFPVMRSSWSTNNKGKKRNGEEEKREEGRTPTKPLSREKEMIRDSAVVSFLHLTFYWSYY